MRLRSTTRKESLRTPTCGSAAGARAVGGGRPTPTELFEQLSHEGTPKLREPCPKKAYAQCWHTEQEAFEAPEPLLKRVARHRALFEKRGVELISVRSSVICTDRLNQARRAGRNRFVVDLHSMESLVLALRKQRERTVTVLRQGRRHPEYSRSSARSAAGSQRPKKVRAKAPTAFRAWANSRSCATPTRPIRW